MDDATLIQYHTDVLTNAAAVAEMRDEITGVEKRTNDNALIVLQARDGAVGAAGLAESARLSTSIMLAAAQAARDTAVAAAAGFVWKGAYNVGTAYVQKDVVLYSGALWIAKASSTGILPGSDGTKWELFLPQGVQGEPGSAVGLKTVKVVTANYAVTEDDNLTMIVVNPVASANVAITMPNNLGEVGYIVEFEQGAAGNVQFVAAANAQLKHQANHTRLLGLNGQVKLTNFQAANVWTLTGQTKA